MSSTKSVGTTTTRTNGDTTITITKVDGSEPIFTVASTSAKVVTIPASFGRRPKTGNKSKSGKGQKNDDTTTKPVDTHHQDRQDVPANRKPTPCGSLLKRPNQPYQPTNPSERHILERAIRHNFAKPGKGLIPPPTRQWSECPAPAASGPGAANGNEKEEDLDSYRGCGPEYDLHPEDDEHFTDVWYDDGE
ncbi:hypothetical protein B0H65DRAFT_592995 [Neurospora tetraspora]|uniref:Uncharacterized protein n=1 Tax=Neurospora tetraspora TaxID=94610 RepID=A0AAE0J0L5_9PEZI|nr:hypothetical protein B0H65DRAFT_592995 [Neurospora tetraspora]